MFTGMALSVTGAEHFRLHTKSSMVQLEEGKEVLHLAQMVQVKTICKRSRTSGSRRRNVTSLRLFRLVYGLCYVACSQTCLMASHS